MKKRALEVKAYAAAAGPVIEVRLTNGWDANVVLCTYEGTDVFYRKEAEAFAAQINRVLATAGTKVPA